MPSTDIDGTPIMILREGRLLSLVVGERTYQGTLQRRGEEWYIKLSVVAPGEPDEIGIHKV